MPERARHVFGGRSQVWQSLDTSELSVARSRLQPLVDEFERQVAKARGEVAPATIARAGRIPSVREIEKAVRVAFLERLDRAKSFNVHNPNERSAAKERLEALRAFIAATEGARGVNQFTAPQDVLWQAEAICEDEGWPLDDRLPHWQRLIDFVARSQIEAASRELQKLEGRPGSIVDAAFASDEFLRDEKLASSKTVQPVSLTGLFEKYAKERKPAPATVKSFGSKVRAFVTFLGHDDASQIAKSDVASWKEHLLERGSKSGGPLNPRSVRETFLPAVRAALELGVSNGDLPENAASGVKVLGPKKVMRLRSARLRS